MKVGFENIELEYDDRGSGHALILLHGYLEAKEVWQPFSEILEKRYRIISVDLPGHGGSGVTGETHAMEFLADAVKAVIDKTGEKKIVMIGHSLGGYVTLAFLEKYPEMLAGYILFHSHPGADSAEAIVKRNREIIVVKSGKKDLMYPASISMMFADKNLPAMASELERSKRIAAGISGEGIIAMLNGMITRPSRTALIEKGIVPMLWLLGRWDKYYSPEKALGTIKLPANARIEILEDSGHMGFIEETSLSVRLVSEFAEKLSW
jgi:pimeloyl-ACP methyl ester carboxylesterase